MCKLKYCEYPYVCRCSSRRSSSSVVVVGVVVVVYETCVKSVKMNT